jgi:hypothetical protein
MGTETSILDAVQKWSADDIEALLRKRQAEDKALRALHRAVLAREREERRQQREEAEGCQ